VALVFAIIGVIGVCIGVASTEAAQRQLPGLGKLPLVHDHYLQVVPRASITRLPVERAARDDREVLQLGRRLQTELDTCRLRIALAIEARHGWRAAEAPPSSRFEEWSASTETASETKLNKALGAFYIWFDTTNVWMAQRERNEQGNNLYLMLRQGLMLNERTIDGLKTGWDFADRAEKLLRQRLDALAQSSEAATG
jgi:hypothetical protein